VRVALEFFPGEIPRGPCGNKRFGEVNHYGRNAVAPILELKHWHELRDEEELAPVAENFVTSKQKLHETCTDEGA
jgi:hypothetical protein